MTLLGGLAPTLQFQNMEYVGENREYTQAYVMWHLVSFPQHHRKPPEYGENVTGIVDHIEKLQSGILPV